MRPPIRRIVAGVATLRPDDPALAAGLRLAARLGAHLHLVHVDTTLAGPRDGARVLREMAERVEPGSTATGRVSCRVVAGTADRRLLAEAREAGADLLVLGLTRRGTVAAAVLGTTADRVLREARVPVLVVSEPLPDRPLRVLLTTDLSSHAAHAHHTGGFLARALCTTGAPEMRSLFVEPEPLTQAPFTCLGRLDDPERELAEFLAAEVPPPPSEPRVRSGDAAVQIAREAREWDADLLVLGTHARHGAPRLVLGSVAETVLRHAPCATLVVPPLRPYPMEGDPASSRHASDHPLAGTVPAR